MSNSEKKLRKQNFPAVVLYGVNTETPNTIGKQ